MKNIRANITDTIYPDYCVGFLYTMLPDTALGTRLDNFHSHYSSVSFSTGANLSRCGRKIYAKNLFWRLLDNRLPSEEDLCLSAAGMFRQLAELLDFFNFQSLTPLAGAHIWDEYLTHCSFLCTIRTIFNPLVLEASSAQDPDFQYVHSLRFLICVFSEFLVYEHLNQVLGNAEFLLPAMCHRNTSWCRNYVQQTAW